MSKSRLQPDLKAAGCFAPGNRGLEGTGAQDSPGITESKTVSVPEPCHLIHWGMEGPKSSHQYAAEHECTKNP